MTPWDPHDPALWPTDSQRLLLRAALFGGEPAIRAWHQWQACHDIASVDPGSYFLLPQLYLNLTQLGISHPALKPLRLIYLDTWAKNLRAVHHLVEVLQLFAAARIPVLILKGMALAQFHYRDLGARMMADCDLLIREQDVLTADAVLQQATWSLAEALPATSLIPFIHAAHYAHPKKKSLDLHWHPFTVDCRPEAEQQFWQRAVEHHAHGVTMYTPEPTDLLILMCAHSRKLDKQATCRWVADAITLISTHPTSIEWSSLFERAQGLGLLLPVRDTLAYLQREFHVDIPAAVMQLAWKLPTSSADEVRYRELAWESRLHRSPAELFASHWWRYAGVSRGRGLPLNPVSFMRYGLAYLQWDWHLQHPWQVVKTSVSRIRSHLRQRLFI